MLVLSRRLRETIRITSPDGTSITISVIRINGRVIRLGIEAPQDYQIMREELVTKENVREMESPQAA